MTQLLDIMDSVELLKTIDTQVHFAYLADKYGAVNLLAICPSMTCTSWIPDCRHRSKMSKTVYVCPTLEFPCCDIKRRGRKRWGPYWFVLTSSICSILSLSTFFSSKVQSALARSLRLPVLLRLHPREGKGVSKIILTEDIFRFGALCHMESAVAGVRIDDHDSHPP